MTGPVVDGRITNAGERDAKRFIEATRPLRDALVDTAICALADLECDLANGDSYDPSDYEARARAATGAILEHLAWSALPLLPLPDEAAIRADERAKVADDAKAELREHIGTSWHSGRSGCLALLKVLADGGPVRGGDDE